MRPSQANRRKARGKRRRAAAAAELALLLPLLCYICAITIDYARLFFAWTTIAECAYNGAYYLADSNVATGSQWTSYQQAALADAANLSPTPTVSSTAGTDSNGNLYQEVTVTYNFSTQFSYPGIPSAVTLTRKLRMAQTPP